MKVTKQETLEEALNKFVRTMLLDQSVYIDFLQCAEFGAKWQQEQDKNKFSEEEVIDIAIKYFNHYYNIRSSGRMLINHDLEWFEQFKNK
jgi:hypothetical protein